MYQQDTKRIPTFIGLLILIAGVIGGVIFAEGSLRFVSRPKKSEKPREIRLTNITAKTASVSWLTESKTQGAIEYWQNDLNKEAPKLAVDDRAYETAEEKFTTHHITLRNLLPKKIYYFNIVVNNKIYDDDGKPFQFSTLPTGKYSDIKPARGRVLNSNYQPAEGALLYLQPKGAYPLSTIVRPSGAWVIPLNTAYSQSNNLPLQTDADLPLNIYVVTGHGSESKVLTTSKKDSPVPDIIAGINYDYTIVSQVAQGKTEVSIIQPKDRQAIPSRRPLIRGRGIPGEKVSIIVESESFAAVVEVDKRGDWKWTPPKALSSGVHTVTINTKDKDGKLITIKRKFLVLKSGSQVLGESTPTATLTPSATEAPSPTTTPVFDTPTPTATSQAGPVAGSASWAVLFIGLGFFLLFLGLAPFLSSYKCG